MIDAAMNWISAWLFNYNFEKQEQQDGCCHSYGLRLRWFEKLNKLQILNLVKQKLRTIFKFSKCIQIRTYLQRQIEQKFTFSAFQVRSGSQRSSVRGEILTERLKVSDRRDNPIRPIRRGRPCYVSPSSPFQKWGKNKGLIYYQESILRLNSNCANLMTNQDCKGRGPLISLSHQKYTKTQRQCKKDILGWKTYNF